MSARGYYRSSGSTTAEVLPGRGAEVLPARDNRRGMAVACPPCGARLAGRRMMMKLWMMMFVMVFAACGSESPGTPFVRPCSPGTTLTNAPFCEEQDRACREVGRTPGRAVCLSTGGLNTAWNCQCGEAGTADAGRDSGTGTDTGTAAPRRQHYEICESMSDCPNTEACTEAGLTMGRACRPFCSTDADCPPSTLAPDAVPFCNPAPANRCFLRCSNSRPCPPGQRCVNATGSMLGFCSTVGMPVNPRTYDPCTRDENCLTGQACTEMASGWGFACRPSCTMDRNCPQADTGTAVPVCSAQRCFLRCSDTSMCPTGQRCFVVDAQGGFCRAQ